jgi:pilus assembly protein CpaF
MDREMTDDEVKDIIDRTVITNGKKYSLSLNLKQTIARDLFYSIRRLDILQALTDDPKVTEIMINGYENIFIERADKLSRWDKKFESNTKLDDVIQQIVAKCNRTVNESSPIVDARLENGSRVNIVLDPIALNGPIVTIRRFPERPYLMKDLMNFGAIDTGTAEFLHKLVIAGYNIFISGGTGSGKTTFLNALSDFIPKDERIITIEDSAELQIVGVENLVRLETRNANVEGCAEITIRDLIRSSLRMRPDRIIVGEVRGAEAIDMVQALNTGHLGFPSCLHYLHRRNRCHSAALLLLPAPI